MRNYDYCNNCKEPYLWLSVCKESHMIGCDLRLCSACFIPHVRKHELEWIMMPEDEKDVIVRKHVKEIPF